MQTSCSPDRVLGSKPCVGGGSGRGRPFFDAADQEWRVPFFLVHMLTFLSHRVPTDTTIIEDALRYARPLPLLPIFRLENK